MKKLSLLFVLLFLSISFSNFSFSSTAYVNGTDKVVAIHFTNPYDNTTSYDWVGTFYGTKDGVDATFYCIDINHFLYFDGVSYIDNGNTSSPITYILNNYYPYIPFPYAGSLSAIEREAAAVQMAIWHFSDGVDVTTGDQPDIDARALQIIADANLNAGNMITDATLVITPTGIPTEFYVTALDQNSNPIPGVTINLSSTSGTVSSSVAVTGPDGKTPVLTVTPLRPDYTAQITASASITIHKGIVYVRSVDPDSYQKLVLAYPYPLQRQAEYSFDDLLPVELSSFVSNVNGRNVSLIWTTKTEKNSYRFEVERSLINGTWSTIASVKAAVLSNSPKNYTYSDTKLQSGKYQYRLKMVDNNGSFSYSTVKTVEVAIPKEFAVSQNYPNPFNPTTKIDYQVPVDARVIMEVYNIAGQRVFELVNQEQSAGYYTIDFGASKLSSGIYIYCLVAIDKATGNNFSSTKKMILLK